MKKLFLLPVIALVAVMVISMANAMCCDYTSGGILTCGNGYSESTCLNKTNGVWWPDKNGCYVGQGGFTMCQYTGAPIGCSDYDGNESMENQIGIIAYINANGVIYEDSCYDSNQVVEYACEGSLGRADKVNCANYDGYNSCVNNHCVPEFTSLGMGIALIGAGAGYALIRRKRK